MKEEINSDTARDLIARGSDIMNFDINHPATLPPEIRQALEVIANRQIAGRLMKSDVDLNLRNLKIHCKTRLGFDVTKETLEADYKQVYQDMLEEMGDDADGTPEEKPKLSEAELEAAAQLGQKDLVTEYRRALRDLGYVADRYTTRSLMHTVFGRLMNKKTGSVHRGRGRSGKSVGLECMFNLTHPANRMRATSITEGALYQLGYLDHLFILGGELRKHRPGDDDSMQQLLRQFLSEPELTRIRLEEQASGKGEKYKLTSHTVGGYASVAWTTTQQTQLMHDEFASRLTAYPSNESAATTMEVQKLKAARAKDPLGAAIIQAETVEKFNKFDLSLEPLSVAIPFADQIILSSKDTTARAIFEQLLEHIQISALYNQHNRARSADGCIIATVEDYESAHELVAKGAFKAMETVSREALELYELIKKQQALAGKDIADFTLQDLIDWTEKPRSTLQGYVLQLLRADMMVEIAGPRNNAKHYLLKERTIAKQDLGMVSPDALRSNFGSNGEKPAIAESSVAESDSAAGGKGADER